MSTRLAVAIDVGNNYWALGIGEEEGLILHYF